MNARYQLVVLGPNADHYPDRLEGSIRKGFEDLGLDPNEDLTIIDAAHTGPFDEHHAVPVGLWFGGTAAASVEHEKLLDRLRDVGAPVLPLVEDVARFQELVPEALRSINGLQWDDEQAAGDVLRGFRLTRGLRQAFLSYRRTDARLAAEGLFDALSERRYQIFLDTASVESMEPFQSVLWDRMADVDLLVLLDSPQALNSRWVNDELVQVNNLGLGVLQLIWPNHGPYKGTELSTREQLGPGDFEGSNHGPDGRLTAAALKKIVDAAEEVRIRSLGARRTRVIGEFLKLVPPQLRADVQPYGPIMLGPASAAPGAPAPPLGIALPIIGFPDARSLHREQLGLNGHLSRSGIDEQTLIEFIKQDRVRAIYDGLGIRKDRSEHLIWLNGYLPVKTVPIDRTLAASQGSGKLGAWLASLAALAARGPDTGGDT